MKRAVTSQTGEGGKSESAGQVVEVLPRGVYRLSQVKEMLGLYATTLRAERAAGRLRVGRRGRRWYVLGSWLLEWLEAGELPRRVNGNGHP